MRKAQLSVFVVLALLILITILGAYYLILTSADTDTDQPEDITYEFDQELFSYNSCVDNKKSKIVEEMEQMVVSETASSEEPPYVYDEGRKLVSLEEVEMQVENRFEELEQDCRDDIDETLLNSSYYDLKSVDIAENTILLQDKGSLTFKFQETSLEKDINHESIDHNFHHIYEFLTEYEDLQADSQPDLFPFFYFYTLSAEMNVYYDIDVIKNDLLELQLDFSNVVNIHDSGSELTYRVRL